MARSRSPHPRLAASPSDHREDLWKRRLGAPLQRLYADTRRVKAIECNGQYVIENPKLDEVLKVNVFKGRVSVVRISWIRADGPKRVGEERYDGAFEVHRLLTEDGSPLVGTWRFRAVDGPGTVGQGGVP